MQINHHEILVVGGGIAGLAAAWTLRARDVLLLEENNSVGGRMRSVVRDPYWVNMGAHLLGSEDSTTNLARELDVRLVSPQGSLVNIARGGRIIHGGRIEGYPFRLPLALSARLSLIHTGLRIRLAHLQARRAIGGMDLTGTGTPLEVFPVNARLDALTFRQVAGQMDPWVETLIRGLANRVTGELDSLSGHHGAMFALEAGGGRPRPVPAGGLSTISDRLRAMLGNRVQTSARVERVEQSDASVRCRFRLNGADEEVSAEYAVIAVPAPVACQVVADLPDEKRQALERVRYAPWVVAGIFTNETAPMPWDNMYAMATPEASFCFFFNPGNALRGSAQRAPGGSLVLYTSGDRAAELAPRSDQEIRDRYLSDLYEIFPEARGLAGEVIIQRWPYGGPIVWPGRARIERELVAPAGRLHFAGDYLKCSGVDFAAWTGIRAAQAVEARLNT